MKNEIFILATFVVAFATLKNQAQTVTDIDGNVYHTVKIGTQVWMVENLKVTHYRNGVSIPNISDDTEWQTLKTSAYCNYNYNAEKVVTYGMLYNWYAVADKNNICPEGWHIPTDAEWNILEKYLDNTVDVTATGDVGVDIGSKLKETGMTHWNSPNIEATNSSSFTALPGGSRNTFRGDYGYIGELGYWWSATEFSGSAFGGPSAWRRYLSKDNSKINRGSSFLGYGMSVRCVKD